jgi:GDP-4-dehydro-6-deoxy-D-mannose reductase
VGDVVRAYELAALHGVSGEVYTVCSGRAVVIREALQQLLRRSTAAIRIETDPDRLRPVDAPEMRGSHDKLTTYTGWRPEISFDQLLSELLEYWRSKEEP